MLPYIAAGFAFGAILYPWFGASNGLLTLPEEAARQLLLLAITAFIAAKIRTPVRIRSFPLWIPACITTVICLIVGSLILRDCPFVPGDEDEYLFQAAIFQRGHLTAPAPDPAGPFWAPGILVHEDRWMGHHQPAHSLFITLGSLFQKPRAISALMTGTVVLLVGLTTQTLAGPAAGAMAALLAMSSPMFIMTGASLVSENSSIFLFALTLWLLISRPMGQKRSILAAGLALGLLLNVRLVTGCSAVIAALIITGRSHSLRIAPGVIAGVILALMHNLATTGKLWIFPFMYYEPDAFGLKEKFGAIHVVGHMIRNASLLNFWLLGWPISLLLLRKGSRLVPVHIRLSFWIFIGLLFGGYAFYWHPGQIATGPLRLYETAFPLIILSAVAWTSFTRRNTFLARYIPLAIAAGVLSFLPGRMAVLADFVTVHQEERLALDKLNIDGHTIILAGRGNLFHYPRNDPWLSDGDLPIWVRQDEFQSHRKMFSGRPEIRLTARCMDDSCTWQLHALPRKNEESPTSRPMKSYRNAPHTAKTQIIDFAEVDE